MLLRRLDRREYISERPMVNIRHADTPDAIATAKELFREYQLALGVDLSFQAFDDEVATLPGSYAPPTGRLLLAYDDAHVVGCIALRRIEAEACEMKRLYVRPSARGTGVGRRLAEQVIDEAREMGYQTMYLDTLPSMAQAQRLYQDLGFKDIPPYRHNPVPGARYLSLDL